MCIIPTNYTVAINLEDSKFGVYAVRTKFDSLVENNTVEWQKAPRDKNIVGSRWVYTRKNKHDGSYEFKAWFVVKSNSQIYVEDYRETFALTTKWLPLDYYYK